MTESNDQSADLLPITGKEAKAIGDEYELLRQRDALTESEKDRIAEILELAVCHPEVEFWVSNATARVAMTAELLTDTAKKEYQNQKALLREHLGNPDLPPVRGRAALPKVSPDSIAREAQAQVELQRMKIVLEKENIAQPAAQRKARNKGDTSS